MHFLFIYHNKITISQVFILLVNYKNLVFRLIKTIIVTFFVIYKNFAPKLIILYYFYESEHSLLNI